MSHGFCSGAPRDRRLPWFWTFVVAGSALASPSVATGDSVTASPVRLPAGAPATILTRLGIGTQTPRLALADTIEIVARRPGLSLQPPARSAFLPYPALLAPRPVPVEVLLRPNTIRISRFACALYGADRGAGTAAALSGLGLVTGALDGKKAGYLMGAGAILGALWGGTAGAEDPRFRFRIEAAPATDGERRERIDPDQIRSSRHD